jgi:uncharacterized DUF497 family protein
MKQYSFLTWDDWNVEHIARHDVIPEEVEEVVFSRRSRLRRGRGDDIYYSLGKTDAGRFLFVVMRDLGHGTAHPITARDMTHPERNLYKSLL